MTEEIYRRASRHTFPWKKPEFKQRYHYELEINLRKFSDQINSSEMDTILLVDLIFSSLRKNLIKPARQAERALGLVTSSGITKTKNHYGEISLEMRKMRI